MSTIKTDTLSNVAGSKTVPMNTVVDGSAKAWVNFNGTGTVAIRASGNVSSITDDGTGQYTVSFTNALSDANYAASVTAGGSNANYHGITLDQSTARTTTAIRVGSYHATVGYGDSAQMGVAIFR